MTLFQCCCKDVDDNNFTYRMTEHGNGEACRARSLQSNNNTTGYKCVSMNFWAMSLTNLRIPMYAAGEKLVAAAAAAAAAAGGSFMRRRRRRRSHTNVRVFSILSRRRSQGSQLQTVAFYFMLFWSGNDMPRRDRTTREKV
jgi:hypothetical protein